MRYVTVLGIHDGHDAGAAIVRNGIVISAVQEERLVNIKHYSGLPTNSIKTVLRISDIPPSDINLIAIAGLIRTTSPLKEEESFRVRTFNRLSPLVHHGGISSLLKRLLARSRRLDELHRILAKVGLGDTELTFIEHHQCHAACAYYSSPWPHDKDSLILTADGAGDLLSSTVCIGSDFDITRIASSSYYDSLGNVFYSEITRYLGMTPWDHEYKVMGLAPYGKPDTCIAQMQRIIDIDENDGLRFRNKIGAYSYHVQPKLSKMLRYQRFDNIAAAAQLWLEQLLVSWIRNAIDATNIDKICCAGGIFLNVKANKKILEMEDVKDAFFYPAAGDDGVAIGAALEGYGLYCRRDGLRPERHALQNLYFGPSFGEEEIAEALKREGLLDKADYYEDMDSFVGELLAKGKVVARFDGRLEYGPRALGNRSILADPRDYKTTWKINFMIKQRDFWMPFAPSILENRADDYLINPRSSPYMILSFDTTDRRNEIVAGIHPKDKTCRPQTVSSWNESYSRLLRTFETQTGIGGILNTSFNLHGYPIVGTPELAIWTFKNSGLDFLALGNFLVEK